MPSFQKLVILFTRYPVAGECKTRMIPTLGTEGAASLHRQLVAHILLEIDTFISDQSSTELTIFFDGDSRQQMQDWLGHRYTYKKQQGEHLGQRMSEALIHGTSEGKNPILIGSDCPAINKSIFHDAFEALAQNDIVLGPAHDGGYYLIGVANDMQPAVCKQLFRRISWGTDTVLSQTLVQIKKLNLRYHLLDKLHDIDTAEDLKHFNYCPNPQ